MSKTTPTIETIDDLVLGVVGSVLPPCEHVDHAVRLLSTWSGNDKLLMLSQYGAKLLVPLLKRRAELQFRVGRREKPVSHSTEGLSKFASQISLTRRVSGFWGLLTVLKGVSALERNRPASRLVLNLQRLQGLSMLLFYPLDYLSFFSSPLAPLLRNVSPAMSAKAGLWSVRAWGAYVGLQIALLLHQWKELSAKQRVSSDEVDRQALQKQKREIMYQLFASITRLPVILHWSIIGGFYNNELWTDVLSFISGAADFGRGWEGSRLPAPKR